MEKTFVDGQIQSVFTSDGDFTIGYVAGEAAEWTGNAALLNPGDVYYLCGDGAAFGVDAQSQFVVENGRWTRQ